jgi:Co/Zn/Cd efflux system component
MIVYTIFIIILFAYIAGACGEGMRQTWKKNAIIIFFLLMSAYFCVALIGQVSSNPL